MTKSYKVQHISSDIIGDGKQRDSFSVPQISISQANGKLPDQKKDVPERGTYSKSFQSLLLCISMSVGLGNVWRFPNVAYNNGGGAFLIPYLLLLVIIGRPLYYMELVIGQFCSQGPIKVWRCVPAFKGIGYAQVISVSFVVIFYNYLMALSLFYMFASMQKCLPWACDESGMPVNETFENASFCAGGNSRSECYWIHDVLEKSPDEPHVLKSISWKLVLCLLLTWIIVYISVVQGVDSLGRMSYFTACFPYIVITALLIVACLEPGADKGIVYFFKPKWEQLLNIKVWYRACEQSFFSLAIGYGNIVMIASYNKFDNNVNRDAIIISIMDTLTNILAGCVIFAVLGTLSVKFNKNIEDVVNHEGMGLAFVAYPQALANIKHVPQLWSLLFFFMLFTLGIGSSMSQIETILTVFKDRYPSLRSKKWLLSLCICCVFFCLGLPLTTNIGQSILVLLNNYGVGAAVFLYATFEVIGFMWVYGINNFCEDMVFMMKKPVGIFWKITWAFTAPVALIVIFIYGNIADKQQTDSSSWTVTVGWLLAAVALVQIPIWFCLIVYRNPHSGILEKLRHSLQPTSEWGPSDPVKKAEWLAMKTPSLKTKDSIDISSSIPPVYENESFREDVF